MCGTLMDETGTPSVLGWTDDVVARMGKGVRDETAIIVPLGTHTRNPVTFVVRKAEDMSISTRSCRMNAVGALQLPAAPPTAGTEEVIDFQLFFVLEDNEPTVSHLVFKCFDEFAWRHHSGCQVNALHLST